MHKHPQHDNPQWFDSPQCLADLWRWLDSVCQAPEDPGYFMEKPYKWEGEWKLFLECYVCPGCNDDESEATVCDWHSRVLTKYL